MIESTLPSIFILSGPQYTSLSEMRNKFLSPTKTRSCCSRLGSVRVLLLLFVLQEQTLLLALKINPYPHWDYFQKHDGEHLPMPDIFFSPPGAFPMKSKVPPAVWCFWMSLYPVLFCIYPTPSGVILAQGLTGTMSFQTFSLLPIVMVATLVSPLGYALGPFQWKQLHH